MKIQVHLTLKVFKGNKTSPRDKNLLFLFKRCCQRYLIGLFYQLLIDWPQGRVGLYLLSAAGLKGQEMQQPPNCAAKLCELKRAGYKLAGLLSKSPCMVVQKDNPRRSTCPGSALVSAENGCCPRLPQWPRLQLAQFFSSPPKANH